MEYLHILKNKGTFLNGNFSQNFQKGRVSNFKSAVW